MSTNARSRTDRTWWMVVVLSGIVYSLINLGLPRVPLNGLFKSYVIQPIIWGLLAWRILRLPRNRVAAKIKDRAAIIQSAFMVGFFQVVFYAIGGLFSNFGKSPNSFKPMSIAASLILVSSMLSGMELSRAWLINHLGKHRGFLALTFISVLYTLLSIPIAQLTGLRPKIESVSYVNTTLLPALAENLLATLFANLAGPAASMAYRGTLQAFWWFCPILPDLSWVFKGLIGTVMPIVGLALVQSIYTERGQKVKHGKEDSLAGWVLTSALSVVIMWFSIGVFPIRPSTILTGSMRPVMEPGDVAIVAKVSADTINVDDIIQFRTTQKIHIIHRVIMIEEIQGKKLFITKGDANNTADSDPVIPDNVVGKVILTVRKLGWLSVIVKRLFGG